MSNNIVLHSMVMKFSPQLLHMNEPDKLRQQSLNWLHLKNFAKRLSTVQGKEWRVQKSIMIWLQTRAGRLLKDKQNAEKKWKKERKYKGEEELLIKVRG